MDIDPANIEEVPYNPLPFPIPPVETLIKNAAINVMKGQTPDGRFVVLLQFITPVMIYAIQLDENAATSLSDEIRPSGLVRASAVDLPPGAKV